MSQERYRFGCAHGSFVIQMDRAHAPRTCAYFDEKFADPDFDNACVFRIVTQQNSDMRPHAPIRVIQMGLNEMGDEALDDFEIETTGQTGLLHKKWTVSAARMSQDKAYPSFFVCMRDEPALDFGGARHEDGLGFSAFGQVVEGQETLKALFQCAEDVEFMGNTIPVSVEPA